MVLGGHQGKPWEERRQALAESWEMGRCPLWGWGRGVSSRGREQRGRGTRKDAERRGWGRQQRQREEEIRGS